MTAINGKQMVTIQIKEDPAKVPTDGMATREFVIQTCPALLKTSGHDWKCSGMTVRGFNPIVVAATLLPERKAGQLERYIRLVTHQSHDWVFDLDTIQQDHPLYIPS